MENAVFRYLMVSADNGPIHDKLTLLAGQVREHSARHDFAQAVLVDEIAIDETTPGGPAVLVPFRRGHLREFTAINHYIRQRAIEGGLRIVALVLPDGEHVPLG